jgi:uncharacterized protein
VTPPLAVFLDAPRLGAVKPRLAEEIGDRHALRLYRVMAARALTAVRAAGLEAIVWFAPPDARSEMEFWLGNAWELRPQQGSDPGARLASASAVVPRGQPWIALFADCPALNDALLRQACTGLERVGLVIGPSHGGRYYLIGGRTPLPDIFTAIPWGTSRVLSETRARLTRISAAWHELPTLREVNTADEARSEGLLN